METAPIGVGIETAPVAASAWQEPAVPFDRERPQAMVARWGDNMNTACEESRIDQNFFDTQQWTSDERRILELRQQPVITANRIKPAVNGIVGIIERGRTDPKAWPRTPNDEGSAELATDTLRFICDRNRFQSKRTAMLTDELISGWTACLVEVDGERNVNATRIRWEELIWDPSSRERDLSDAKFLGIGKWRYIDDIKADFPAVPDEQLRSALSSPSLSLAQSPSTMEDRPFWADHNTNRLFTVELYCQHAGEWWRVVFVRGLILEAAPSAYKDTKGRTRCPIEGVRAYVDIRNQPYGVVRDMRDPQRETNMRRSRILHELAHRQVLIEEGAVDDEEKFRREMARADGLPKVLDGMLEKVHVLDRSDKVQWQAQLLAEAKQEIERQGPNPGVLGRDVKGQSGRAILAQQQAGLLELATVLGWFDDFTLRIYRQMWLCAQQFGTPEDFIRIVDSSEEAKFVQTWVEEPAIDPNTGLPQMEAVTDPATGAPAIDPNTGGPVIRPVVTRKNVLAELDVDLVLDSAPDVAVIEEEQFQVIAELLPVVAQIPNPQIQAALPELVKRLILSSSLRNKRDLAKAMEAEAAPDPAQQAALQLQAQAAQADVEKTQSETAKNVAAAGKTKIETALLVADHGDRAAGDDPGGRDREQRERMAGDDRSSRERMAMQAAAMRQAQARERRPGAG